MIRLDRPEQVGPALQTMRWATDRTQRDVARSARTTQVHVSRWENSSARPSVAALIRLADALGYDLALIPRESP
jgi:transcriptional regulator with XRE-family HTH domain